MNWTEEQLTSYQKKRGLKKRVVKSKNDKPKKVKYNNQKTVVDGRLIDSLHEARRYKELLLLEKGGEITALQTQVKFLIEKGNNINKAVHYIADFVYMDCRTCKFVVEDAKGKRTRTYINKKKAMFNRYGIDIQEV